MRKCFLLAMATTLAVAGCQKTNPRLVTTLNHSAAIVGNASIDPLGWKAITSGLNSDQTMFTLFGNDSAVEYSRTNGGREYPVGSVLSLVTWRQQEDSRWFGARIPAAAKSVEVVTVNGSMGGRTTYAYQSFEGIPLKQVETSSNQSGERAAFLLSQRAAVMP